jgi:plasmid stabilization system protein ParE
VDAALSEIAKMPKRFPEVSPGIRRCLVQTFPYAAYFALDDDLAVIMIVVHSRRIREFGRIGSMST